MLSDGIPPLSQKNKGTNVSNAIDLWDYFEKCIGCSLEKEEIQVPGIHDPILVPKVLVTLLSLHLSKPFQLSFSEKRAVQFSDCCVLLDPLTQELLCLQSKFFSSLWQGTFKESSIKEVTDLKSLSFEEFKNILCIQLITIDLSIFREDKRFINLLCQYVSLIETLNFLELDSLKRACLVNFSLSLSPNAFFDEPNLEVSRTIKEICENINPSLFPFPSIKHVCERFLNYQLEKFIETDSKSFVELATLCEGIPIKKIHLKSNNFVGSNFKDLHLISSLEEVTLEGCQKFQETHLSHLAKLPLKAIRLIKCKWFKNVNLLKDSLYLEQLTIKDCPSFTGEELNALQGLPIRELNLSECKALTGQGISHLKNLKSLNLSSFKTKEKELNLKDLPLLENLKLNYYQGSLDILAGCQNLKNLELKCYWRNKSEFTHLNSIPH